MNSCDLGCRIDRDIIPKARMYLAQCPWMTRRYALAIAASVWMPGRNA